MFFSVGIYVVFASCGKFSSCLAYIKYLFCFVGKRADFQSPRRLAFLQVSVMVIVYLIKETAYIIIRKSKAIKRLQSFVVFNFPFLFNYIFLCNFATMIHFLGQRMVILNEIIKDLSKSAVMESNGEQLGRRFDQGNCFKSGWNDQGTIFTLKKEIL